jgi:hypothetical protein
VRESGIFDGQFLTFHVSSALTTLIERAEQLNV